MLPLRFAHRWQIASAILLIAVLVAAMVPAAWLMPDKVSVGNWLGGADKWAHALAFAVLTVWFSGLYRRSAYWRIAICMLAYGILIELCQGLINYRSAEWQDVAADLAGIGVGITIALLGAGGWCMSIENWFQGRERSLRRG